MIIIFGDVMHLAAVQRWWTTLLVCQSDNWKRDMGWHRGGGRWSAFPSGRHTLSLLTLLEEEVLGSIYFPPLGEVTGVLEAMLKIQPFL